MDIDFVSSERWAATFHDASRYKDGIVISRTPGHYLYQQPSYDPHDLLSQQQIDAALSTMSPEGWQAALANLIDSGKLEYRLRTVSEERDVTAGSFEVPADLPILDALGRGAERWATDRKMLDVKSAASGRRAFVRGTDRLELDGAGRPAFLTINEAPDSPDVVARTDYSIRDYRST